MPLLSISHSGDDVVIEWTIAAARTTVWAGLTNTDAIAAWLGTPILAEIRSGGSLAVDHGEGYICQSIVQVVEVDSRFALSWHFPDEHETNVSFGLVDTDLGELGSGCRLALRHSNLAALADSYRIGWLVHLTYLEAHVLGDPIPSSQFWNLHATMRALSDQGHSG